MKTARIPWHHKDSDYVPQESSQQKKWTFRIVRESTPNNADVLGHEVQRARLNDDSFVFGNKPFDIK